MLSLLPIKPCLVPYMIPICRLLGLEKFLIYPVSKILDTREKEEFEVSHPKRGEMGWVWYIQIGSGVWFGQK